MLSFLCALAVATAPTPLPADAAAVTTKRLKLLVLDVKSASADDIDAGQVETLTAYLAARAARFDLEVVSSSDIRERIEIEGDKQAIGCDTNTNSCLADIAGALGAELVLSSRAGKLDALYLISLQLFDARASSALARTSVQAWSLAEATPQLGAAIDEMLTKTTGAKPSEPSAAVAPLPKSAVAIDGTMRASLLIGGGATAAVGVVTALLGAAPALLYGQKKQELTALTERFEEGSGPQLAQARTIHREAVELRELYNGVGRWAALAGAVLVAAGAASLAAAFLLPVADEGDAT